MNNERWKRALGVILLVLVGGLGVGLIFRTLVGSSGLYLTPDKVVDHTLQAGEWVMIGGRVEPGSLTRMEQDPLQVRFALTYEGARVWVQYRGILPDLFEEGEDAAVRGHWTFQDELDAVEVLAKHDEEYKPPAP